MREIAVAVEGIALWAPRLPDWDTARAVIRGETQAPEAARARPVAAMLAPTERRRAPDCVAVALEVAAKATQAAGRAATEMPAVFASTHGDTVISDYMCATLASTPALISPTKFHNSVHNAAAGYWSIGTGSTMPYTAISAFRQTFGVALLEAAIQVVCNSQAVLLVAFDTESQGPLATVAASRGLLGVALVLGPELRAGACGLRLRTALQAAGHGGSTTITPANSPAVEYIAGNALAPCLPLMELLARQQETAIALALGERLALHVRLVRG